MEGVKAPKYNNTIKSPMGCWGFSPDQCGKALPSCESIKVRTEK